ncbi:coiled-coil domain-containing protein 134-like isoform X2 [Stegodyphus dumicola]|uniref:coiled-coil domain-containing protein 134-like isoform X2 n=1 Tax=Stegodyphus dumicola TaxID=202533 RepID=UPI0015A88A78|nr:coiled-coil domain-containing protein 134-like isoform X2 [Stegodyphus dumicola]
MLVCRQRAELLTIRKLTRIYLQIFNILYFLFIIFCLMVNATEPLSELETNSSTEAKPDDSRVKLFKAIFHEKRLQHKDVIQNLLSQDYKKQYKIINQTLVKLFEVMGLSKTILEHSGYIPGLDVPVNNTVSEALGQILDNTALYGDFQLKLPDITDRIMKNHPDWLVLIKWAIGFSNSTELFNESTMHMIDLLEEPVKEAKQKKRVTIKKGPRMSKQRHTEF